MMKRIGLIGGIGPESTVDYYNLNVVCHQSLKSQLAIRATKLANFY